MSKGGAGKVYFVLYLAVILELLIIFIERDEAEEGLRKQQREALEIVQTILSQLTTGSGATGITASPKDNITINEEKPSENVRNYDVQVAVGDPKVSYQVQGRTIRGDDVAKLSYIVSHTGDKLIPEDELPVDSLDINGEAGVIFQAELGTLVNPGSPYTVPRQVKGGSIPAENTEAYFTLNEQKTNDQLARGHRIKVFSVNFKPNQGEGWYRLRFASETNMILGVTGDPKTNDTVRIGNIKLAVSQLRKVQKVLHRSGSKDTASANKVLSYIETLLKPGAYSTLPENRGTMSFDVHVVKPPGQKPQDPVAAILTQGDTLYWYEGAPLKFRVRLGPPSPDGSFDTPQAQSRVPVPGQEGVYEATITSPIATADGVAQDIVASARNKVGKTQQDRKWLIVEKPTFSGEAKSFKKWKALRATIGRRYDPSSDWTSRYIRKDHYQTKVFFNDKEVFNRPGTDFKVISEGDQKLLTVTEGISKIVTMVYWKPGGDPDPNTWVAIATTTPGGAGGQTVNTEWVGGGVTISYPAPIQTTGTDCEWGLGPRTLKFTCPENIRMVQTIGGREYPVTANAGTCDECAAFGITANLKSVDDFNYQMEVSIDPAILRTKIRELIGKQLDIPIDMKGKGGATGQGSVRISIKLAQ